MDFVFIIKSDYLSLINQFDININYLKANAIYFMNFI